MITFLIVIISLLQPQSAMVDTLTHVPVLHDSLSVQNGEVLSLSRLEGWEFTTDNVKDTTASVNWIKLDKPVSGVEAFPDSLWNGFGWYRLTFKVDSSFSLKKSFLRFESRSNVAAEIYLNDELVLKIGNPSRNKAAEEIVASYADLGQPITLEADTKYVLTVKKSFHRFPVVNTLTFGNAAKPYRFAITVSSKNAVNSDIEDAKKEIFLFSMVVIVISLLSLLYLFLYFKVRDQKENLWLVLLMVSIGIVASYNLLYNFTIHQFWIFLLMDSLLPISAALALTLIPLVTHKLLKVRSHILWKVYAVVGALIYVTPFFEEIAYGFVLVLMISITGGLFAIYKAYKQGIRDTLIPAVSILGLPATLVAFQITYFFGIEIGNSIIPDLILFLTLPVGLSLYQGKKFLRLHLEMDDLVQERTNELEQAYSRLQKSLKELQAAQEQLVQQEKLASLGQLTAGIAHEIKNPLNFVNNFSELSVELIEEIRDEVGTYRNTPLQDQGVEEISNLLNDIETNLKKIHEHGSRADGIVKSMLEHSRGGSGKIEPTDFNGLVKEYVNLSFHGMRAGRNPINVDIDLQLDESIGNVPLIAEDFSRVIINLCNNAFDAMRTHGAERSAHDEDYKAKLTVRTKAKNGKVTVEIEDNGPGIPEDMKDKIMQPFFTTKKGTEGTGLGLSITNDIIKAHGGTISMKSEKNEFTLFRVTLTQNEE